MQNTHSFSFILEIFTKMFEVCTCTYPFHTDDLAMDFGYLNVYNIEVFFLFYTGRQFVFELNCHLHTRSQAFIFLLPPAVCSHHQHHHIILVLLEIISKQEKKSGIFKYFVLWTKI